MESHWDPRPCSQATNKKYDISRRGEATLFDLSRQWIAFKSFVEYGSDNDVWNVCSAREMPQTLEQVTVMINTRFFHYSTDKNNRKCVLFSLWLFFFWSNRRFAVFSALRYQFFKWDSLRFTWINKREDIFAFWMQIMSVPNRCYNFTPDFNGHIWHLFGWVIFCRWGAKNKRGTGNRKIFRCSCCCPLAETACIKIWKLLGLII